MPWPQRRLTEDGWHDGYNAPFATRFLPTASDQHRELVSPTLGWRWVTMAAGDGEAVQLEIGVDVGELWCSSGEDQGTKGGGGLWRSFRGS
jgi:hypothetical protein